MNTKYCVSISISSQQHSLCIFELAELNLSSNHKFSDPLPPSHQGDNPAFSLHFLLRQPLVSQQIIFIYLQVSGVIFHVFKGLPPTVLVSMPKLFIIGVQEC